MDYYISAITCMAIASLNLLVNIFFSFCIFFSPEKIKQPLKILLQILIFCSILFLVTMLIWICVYKNTLIFVVLFFLSYFSMATSMTTSVWLSVFYYTQIVPARRALSIWIKKNIKSIIYVALIFERLWISTDIAFDLMKRLYIIPDVPNNTTTSVTPVLDKAGKDFYTRFMWLLKMYLVFSLCVMVVTNASISRYLIGHIQSLSASGQSFSSPKFLGQLRVAVTGNVQSLLYMTCVVWFTYDFVLTQILLNYSNFIVNFTVLNVYMLGTTLNMWVGQAVFRQRTVDIFGALKGKLKTRRRDDEAEAVKTEY